MAGMFVFPFELVEKGSRIALYGAGKVGQAFYKQLLSTGYCKIAYWIDLNYKQIRMPDLAISPSPLSVVEKNEIDYFVVAINNEATASQIIQTLQSIFSNIPIIWRKPDSNTHVDLFDSKIRRERLQISNLIGENVCLKPHKETGGKKELFYVNTEKKKIRFFYAYLQFWNIMKSLAVSCQEDPSFDVLFVGCECEKITENKYVRKKQVEELRIKYIDKDDYDIAKDQPDISIIVLLYNPYAKAIRDNSKNVICIYPSLIKQCGLTIKEQYQSVKGEVANLSPDYVIIDRSLYFEMKENGIEDEKLKCFGNPKFDEIFSSVYGDNEIPKEWEKLSGKKIILWSTDHHWTSGEVSIDEYAKEIIHYFDNHKEMGCIFRPHRVLILELIWNRVWSEDDLISIKDYFNKSENMVWDENPSYDNAYRICDGVLVDLACGMIISTLPLDVPVAGVYRKDGKSIIADIEIAKSLYKIDNTRSLISFFDMVKMGLDPQKEVRHTLCNKYIGKFDGNNGRRIRDFLKRIML